jgi:hypothetical protein
MSAALRVDALKFVRRLTDVGLERNVAEAIVEGLSDIDSPDLATRADLEAIKSELKSELKAAIAESKAEIFRFMLLQAVGIIGLTVTLIKLLP